MVEVVFEKVVFREVLEVGVLDEGKVGRLEESDVHGEGALVFFSCLLFFLGIFSYHVPRVPLYFYMATLSRTGWMDGWTDFFVVGSFCPGGE